MGNHDDGTAGIAKPLLGADEDSADTIAILTQSADAILFLREGVTHSQLWNDLLDYGPDLALPGESVAAEATRVVGLATPIVVSELLGFCAHLITTAQAGALGATALSAFVVASTIYDITGLSIVFGLGSGLSTFTGSAYGAGKFGLVGVYLQRACAVSLLVASLAVAGWWWGAEYLLLALGQDPDLVPEAAAVLRLMAPSLLPWAMQMPLHTYFATQGVVVPLAVIAGGFTLLTPIVNYLLVHTMGLGIMGIAHGYNVLAGLEFAAQVACVVWLHYQQPSHAKTWSGWNLRAALSEWPAYLKIALPSMAMICLDWWCYKVVILVAGLQPNADVQLAAAGILFTTHSLSYTVCSGFGTAAATRVSNELGASNGPAARRATAVCALAGLCLNILVAAVLYVFRDPWARLYTPDDQVVHEICGAMIFMAVAITADSVNAVGSGVLRGCGKQTLGFIVNLITFWGVGIPLVYKLDVVDGLGARGVWMALAGVSVLQGGVLLCCMATFNWRQLAVSAQDILAFRSKSLVLVTGMHAGPGGHHGVFEPVVIQRRHSMTL